ncbi:peptidylprolyl isomerase [Kordiimonas sp. SCSIO 12610]|uniref:peptidylprolyl isomerase n=1 Tax=Kordiimonas sp. SCSIO 12610 TaxID=2829597 RepID=UPI00210A5BE5|nr:peptidylprolyl isomerase [Kordiimonas sp. SCSIO 12610]UTW53875.1 peptidylprolyl isomerase [Kordiimonas sp. SCSIO 12610]
MTLKNQLQKLVLPIATFLTGTAIMANGVYAQQPNQPQAINSIEVLVNDQPISSFDINQRLRLVIAISGGVKNEEEFLKVREQVIRAMVDERLQIQEAAENEVNIEDAQLEDFFVRRAEGLGQSPEQLSSALDQIGASKETMMSQIEAEVVWAQLAQRRLGPFVSISDEEVDAYIQRLYDNKGKFEYRLGEIVLLVNSAADETSVKATADEIVQGIKDGAAFSEIANQLSASSTAATGGDLGWVTLDDIEGLTQEDIDEIGVGNISKPIRTAGGYVIFSLNDRRRILTADPLDTQLQLRQVHLSTEKLADSAVAAQFEQTVSNLSSDATCEQVPDIATQAGADGAQDIGVIRVRDLQGDARTAVQKIDGKGASSLLKMEDGWRVLFVCERREATVQEPDFDQVYNQLEQQRMSMMARRYLRDIRRDAIVDYR